MNDVAELIGEHSDALARIVGQNVAVILICRRQRHGGYIWRAKAKLGRKTLHYTNWFPSADGALRALGSTAPGMQQSER